MKVREVSCVDCVNADCLIKIYANEEGMSDFILKKNTIFCRRSQNVIIEGASVQGLYFIYSGMVKVLNTGIMGREQILRIAKPGEIIGLRGFSTHQHSQVGAVAMEDTLICSFHNDLMKDLLLSVPRLLYHFMNVYAEELNRSETKV